MSNQEIILQLLDSEDEIPKDKVLEWMGSPDLEIQGLVYELTDNKWSLITPELSMNEQCSFMSNYLLTCLETDPKPSDYVFSGYQAAWEISNWFKHLSSV